MASGMIAEAWTSVLGPERQPLPADGLELEALVTYIRAGRCALFVGSGLSAPAGLPTWSDLLSRFIAEATPWALPAKLVPDSSDVADHPTLVFREPKVRALRKALGAARFDQLRLLIRRYDPKIGTAFEVAQAIEIVRRDSFARFELKRLLDQKRFPEIAGHFRENLGRDRFEALVRQALRSGGEPPATHANIVKTPFACIVTTNFDSLLEEAYVRWEGRGIPRAPTGAELAEHGTLLLDHVFFILKAHGDLLRPATMIFTADDYRRVIHANPAFQALLSGILLTHAVLFVGYSLSDTNFRLLLDNQLTIFNGNVPPRFALLGGVEDAEREILWRTAKLRALSFPSGKYGEVDRFLRKLAEHFSPAATVDSKKTSVARPAFSAGRFPGAPSAIPYCTLRIRSQEGALAFELVRRVKGGSAERVWIGGSAEPRWGRVRALMRSAVSGMAATTQGRRDLRTIARLLGNSLPAELCRKLERLARRYTLELVCSAGTDCLPWEWLLVGDSPLCLQRPIVRSPVEIRNSARGFRFASPRLRFLIIGDAGTGEARFDKNYALPGAEREAAGIVDQIRSASAHYEITRLSREEATRERFLLLLAENDYDVIHFGGHAWFDAYESYVVFWDGLILGTEIAPLLSRRPPALLVLNTHFTAFRPSGITECDYTDRIRGGTAQGGAEFEGAPGFTSLAMRCGVTSFVGAFGSMADEPAADLMVAFYAALMRGQTVAEALYTARRQMIRKDPLTPLYYTVSGYPEFRLVTREPGKKTRILQTKRSPRTRVRHAAP